METKTQSLLNLLPCAKVYDLASHILLACRITRRIRRFSSA